jgi:prepilin-type N-terminal cleavage/methylation domain-containing protein
MNNKGFTLIEMMVTTAILSIITLGTMQLLNNMLLASQTADIKANLNSLTTSMAGVAANQITCTQAVTTTPQTFGQAFQFNSI